MNTPFTIEHKLDAPSELVWKAISDRDTMALWYFDLAEFKLELGFKFQFIGGTPEKQYLHLCEITQLELGKKLAYSWRYDGYDGNSEVVFELFEKGQQTIIRLTHKGLETFPASNPDLAEHNFIAGWKHIIGSSLPEFLAKP